MDIVILGASLLGLAALGLWQAARPQPVKVAKRRKKGGVRKVRVYRYRAA